MSPLAPVSIPSNTVTPKVFQASSAIAARRSLPCTHQRRALMSVDRRSAGPYS
jgi:hypothetical protein